MNRNRAIAIIAVAGLAALGHAVYARGRAPEGGQAAKRQAPIELRLAAARRVIGHDAQGKETVDWQSLDEKAAVQSGDVIRYTLTGKNTGAQPVKDLALTEPIPSGTVYILGSATKEQGVSLLFSVNKGKSFAEAPTINVALADGSVEPRPAPAERYTHVRWVFTQPIAPNATVQGRYDVQVR